MVDFPPWFAPEIQQLLLDGLVMTVALTLLTSALASLLALGVLWLRFQRWGYWAARIYVDVFRSLPALILIIILAYGLPNLFDLPTRRALFFRNDVILALREVTGMTIPYYGLAVALGLSLNTSAYLAELVRGGINSLQRNHIESAQALGASPSTLFFTLLLPHGLHRAALAIVTRLVHHLKNTALASFVAVPELFQAAQSSISRTFYALELLTVVAILYLLLTWGWAWLLTRLLPVSSIRLAGEA
jgi:His/Glu/Gln/Arg/opine family amino acid ABC transporter permease subunit